MAIIGAHALLYSSEADHLRATLRDVFGFKHVDAGGGWLIFALPPAELGVHPAEEPGGASGTHTLSLMCDDIQATVKELRAKGIRVNGAPADAGFGLTVMLDLPGRVPVMLYQPRHPVAISPTSSALVKIIAGLLGEGLNGPSRDAYFLNRGDRGLLASLDTLTAEAASARPGGRSSVASHVEHLRYGFELLNRFARGENPWDDADWTEAWTHQTVTEHEWHQLRTNLARETRAWLEVMQQPPAWDEYGLASAIGSLPHMAYHLGAIRQLAEAASGPKATD